MHLCHLVFIFSLNNSISMFLQKESHIQGKRRNSVSSGVKSLAHVSYVHSTLHTIYQKNCASTISIIIAAVKLLNYTLHTQYLLIHKLYHNLSLTIHIIDLHTHIETAYHLKGVNEGIFKNNFDSVKFSLYLCLKIPTSL